MRRKGGVLITLGLLLVLGALGLTGYNLYDEKRADEAAQAAAERLAVILPRPTAGLESLPPEEQEIPDYLLDPTRAMPTEEIGGVAYVGALSIPALGLELPVIDQWSYPHLKLAPCRYRGTAYQDNFVIAAHNYPSHFGGLKNLLPGDWVTFTDLDGNVFPYEVAEIEVLAPTAIREMVGSEYPLTLFTCTLGGAERVTVRCERVVEESATAAP